MQKLLSNSQPRHRTDVELRMAAEHVRYEITMLVYSSKYLGGWHSSPVVRPGGAAKNMALDSFLLHFRNLRAFLCPSLQPTAIDDVIASDFLNEPQSRDLADCERFSVTKARLNKMLAHLSYSRDKYIQAGDYGWDVAEMLNAILSEVRSFVAMLPPSRSGWFPMDQLVEREPHSAQARKDQW